MPGQETSQTLLLKLQSQNDEEAWARFSKEYRPFIYSILKHYQIAHEDIEDLQQDILVKVWKALPDFIYQVERCRFRTWLSRVSRNHCLNFCQSKYQRKIKAEVPVELYDKSTQPEIDTLAEEEWQVFIADKAWTNIEKLFTDKQKEVFLLVSKGKHQSEAAERLGLEVNTAYVYAKKVKDVYMREIRRLNAELDG
ncbi:sigma-70 family RNA polymerase sigma factor [Lentisphaera profundi]|uniref:RNA polymerase sigma factor SigS n=1 Tax=Lentisphaera profundi TaxID=1658616 RepID=A0ABY7VQU5_9BACT|nr:sigma-70 family RNA polymerase sigma factor [Lentisphaera profundi]WDE96561.1 sigma-70 family RNA polymerase sigma factor [Lentisphaera profundi]